MSIESEGIASSPSVAKSLVKLLRPRQWSKNLLVFAAPLFVGVSGHARFAVPTVGAFLAMCFLSSATYIFNDILDIEKDRRHPVKRFRPLASGAISTRVGAGLGVVCFILGMTLAILLGKASLVIVLIYVAMQLIYNWRLKQTPIADVYTIAFGFVLRAALGAAAIGVSLSGWLLFCTGSLALMLGFAKRRNEMIAQGDEGASSRPSLALYSRPALDALVCIFAAGAGICYAIYTIESKTAHKYPALILTSPFVFYGITRYVFLVFGGNEGGEPADVLFKDRHIGFSVAGFFLSALIAMSGVQIPILEQ